MATTYLSCWPFSTSMPAPSQRPWPVVFSFRTGVGGYWGRCSGGVAKVGSHATWQMCLVATAVAVFIFFIVLPIKYLKVSFYAYFAGREPHYQKASEGCHQVTNWPGQNPTFPLSPPSSKNPICQHFNNHCLRALQQLILWPSTFNCLPKQIIFE